jgi:hypothetical protein
MIRSAEALENCRAVLAAGDYDVEFRDEKALGPVLLAETLYALVMAVIVPDEDPAHFVDDAQATMTRYAAVHPSPRSWDLYLVLVVPEDRHRYEAMRDAFESDTRYARKLVVTGDRGTTERLLRLLLPLRPVPEIELTDPLRTVQSKLVDLGLDSTLVDTAVSSFNKGGEVQVS